MHLKAHKDPILIKNTPIECNSPYWQEHQKIIEHEENY